MRYNFVSVILFQPTPSARRVTGSLAALIDVAAISTHTLRMEGDVRLLVIVPYVYIISTHTLRKEGDS